MKALLHTKKMFIDTYGEVPPMIGFLGIDTDGGEYSKKLTSARGEDVLLENNEQLQLLAPGAVDFYKNHKMDFSWIPEENINAVSMLRGLGAGGVRTNGRFAFTVNKNKIETIINAKIGSITSAKIAQNTQYELLADTLPEIHMVFSICGGTGCGTFLNMAYLIQGINPAYKTTGYSVLPGVFKALPACAHVVPNAYGALVDLDYLMHHGIGDEAIELKYLNESYKIAEKPFANVMFVDNENDNYDHYDNVGELAEMISLALVTAAGELSVAGASIGDNFNQLSEEGTLNILNKKAWAGGMGACEIVYRGNTLADVYKYKAGINIIDRMFNTCDDANNIANAWIDSSDVHIRENNGQDHVTDFICSKEPKYPLVINNYKDPVNEVNSNIETNKIKDADISEKIDTLVERVRTQLRALLVKHINRECGISLAKNILDEIKIQIGLCLGEMKQEKEDLVAKKPSFKTGIETTVADLKNAGWLTPKIKKEQLASDVAEAVRMYNTCLIDIQRHDAAITVYNSIAVLLSERENIIVEIEKTLKLAKQNLQTQVAKLQNGLAGEDSIFQINLAEDDAKTLSVKSEDILISEFIDSLKGDMKIYGFVEYSAKEVETFILNFTKTLSGCKSYSNKSVEQLLRDINERNPEELKQIVQKASRTSLPLFKYNLRDRMPKQNIIDMIYVGVEDQANSILKVNDLFKNNLPPASNTVTRNVYFASTGMRDKVIIYHKVGGVPVNAVCDILDYRKVYQHTYVAPVAFHFDANIFHRIERDYFIIDPIPPHTILDMWVKGFIYGLIKNENKCYYMKSKSLGNDRDDYCVKLAEWRDEAFEEFTHHYFIIVKDFNAHINAENERVGTKAIRQRIEEAKANYWEVSQLKIDRATIDSKPYAKVKKLFHEELRKLEEM